MDLNVKLDTEDFDRLVESIVDRLAQKFSDLRPQCNEELMTVKELSAYLKVKETWIYKFVSLNEIPHCKIGKFLRFRRCEIDGWIKSKSTSNEE